MEASSHHTDDGRNPKLVVAQSITSKTIRNGCSQGEWAKLIPGIFNDAKNFFNGEILENFKRASILMQADTGIDHWITDKGQSELLRRIQSESTPPSTSATSRRAWEDRKELVQQRVVRWIIPRPAKLLWKEYLLNICTLCSRGYLSGIYPLCGKIRIIQ